MTAEPKTLHLPGIDDPWRIRDERDARYDGRLFIAITTTRIYCKPSCPSRAAKPENVRFFPTCDAAEKAGFRACLRCKPRLAEDSAAHLVRRVTKYLEHHATENVTLERLSEVFELSPFHLQRVFKKKTGVTPKAWARGLRLRKFQTALKHAPSITDAVYESGYSTSSRAYDRVTAKLGMKPATWRQAGEGASIRYTVTSTEFGWLLAATTDRGICSVRLGDERDKLESEFQKDFARAQLQRDSGLTTLVDQILVLIGSTEPSPHLAVDVRATAFQQRVWDYLRTIPSGETRSYGQVAEDLGAPAATRAVARACATNPVALVVPCHRVIAKDGKLTGYRWGIDKKKRLLEKEHRSLIVGVS